MFEPAVPPRSIGPDRPARPARRSPADSACSLYSSGAVERVAKGDFKRLEPGLEMLPLIETLAKDGLANLLGTRGSHASQGLVELDAPGFEFESAEFQDAAHIALEVVDHVLVMHPQNPAGQ